MQHKTIQVEVRTIQVEVRYILNPQKECLYQFKDNKLPGRNKKIAITFEGDQIDCVQSYDFSTGKLSLKDNITGYLAYPDEVLLTWESFPPNLSKALPYLMVYQEGKISSINKIKVTVDSSTYQFNYDATVLTSIHSLNEQIKQECQALSGKIPVVVGEHPIFLNSEKPTYKILSQIHDRFLQFNTDSKLEDQYNQSISLCAVRAHFVNEMLRQYGIATLKAYKFYNEKEWRNFTPCYWWTMHCAALIVDNKNRKWIWDPWIRNEKSLIPFEKWVKNKNEPKPTKVLITSSVVISDIVNGKAAEAPNFMQLGQPEATMTLHKLVASAIPHPLPEKPVHRPIRPFVIRLNKKGTYRAAHQAKLVGQDTSKSSLKEQSIFTARPTKQFEQNKHEHIQHHLFKRY